MSSFDINMFIIASAWYCVPFKINWLKSDFNKIVLTFENWEMDF